MNVEIPPDIFPSRAGNVSGRWLPILFAPNPDSPERLVLAVVAINGTEFHIEAANAAKRLGCIYGSAAETVLLVQAATISALQDDFAERGMAALSEPRLVSSGIELGEPRPGEARSLRELAQSWLWRVSSVHTPSKADFSQDDSVEAAIATIDAMADNDRLPILVYRAVEESAPDLGNYFSEEIRSRARRTAKPRPQQVFIGFAGAKVVANFATLKPTTRPRPAIDHIKRLMWDLARHRDNESGPLYTQRAHELLVFRRDENDPDVSPQMARDLREMVEDLAEQGRKDDILVQARSSVPSIAEHIRTVEQMSALRSYSA